MKKIGKKISFLTKIMLVIGLLISNLSSLSVVFAYEAPDDLVITLTNDELNIKYTEALPEGTQKVIIYVKESYTYLDGSPDGGEIVPIELDATQIKEATNEAGELEITHTKKSFKQFDGTYKVEVLLEKEVTDGTEVVAYNEYVEEVKFEEGITTKVFNGGVEVSLTDGKYAVLDGNTVVTKFLSGGLAPTWKYTYDETEYTGIELLSKELLSKE